jgi:hypothetical protein
MKGMDMTEAFNIDCMEYMKTLPDNAFELAVVDPPYGDGMGSFKRAGKSRFGGRFDRYKGGENHSVGHCPEGRVFYRTFSCLTQPNYLGRQLFCPTADKVLPDTPENKHSRKFLNGNV